jgi:hypothetical protein
MRYVCRGGHQFGTSPGELKLMSILLRYNFARVGAGRVSSIVRAATHQWS